MIWMDKFINLKKRKKSIYMNTSILEDTELLRVIEGEWDALKLLINS